MYKDQGVGASNGLVAANCGNWCFQKMGAYKENGVVASYSFMPTKYNVNWIGSCIYIIIQIRFLFFSHMVFHVNILCLSFMWLVNCCIIECF